jgi:hypothetical protein
MIVKPATNVYTAGMEFTDYMMWKFIAVCVLAFLYGLCGGKMD